MLQAMRKAAAIALTTLAGALPLHAEAIRLEHAGLELSATFERAAATSLSATTVVLLVHDALAHAGADIIVALQASLKQAAIPSLAPTLSLGLNARRGPFDCRLEHDHRLADAADEIGAWLAWLKSQGVQRIAVLGHAHGALQVLEATATDLDPAIAAVILLSPPATPWPKQVEAYRNATGTDLANLVETARKLADSGEEDSVLEVPEFLGCPKAKASVTAFLEHYGPGMAARTMDGLGKLTVPALVVVGRQDPAVTDLEVGFSAPNHPAKAELLVVPGSAGIAAGQALDAATARIKSLLERIRPK